MTFMSVWAVLALVVTTEASVGPSTSGSFCTETKECLDFEAVCKTDEYEVRHYSPTRWVSTDAEAYFMGVGAAMAFRRLFQYITGANEAGIQMEMTAPVLVKIPEETKMWELAVYTLHFLLPQAYQDKPPAPTNDKLYFTEMPEMDVYVRSYGGWMLSVTSRLHAHLLTTELERVRAPYNHTFHYGVGYDSPFKLLNRHNEVWYVAEGPPVCSDPQEPTPAHTPKMTPSPPANLSSDPLADSASLTATNLTSSNTSDTPADASTDMPTDMPPSPSSSRLWVNLSSAPTSAKVPTDVAPNTTWSASTALSLEPQGDAAMGNSTERILANPQQDGV
ncbi:uncharacterized protein soul5l [Hippocampus comes]|nr:PREDICTED: uncharacterized protein LOC109511045 [Hippocampus comes]